MIVVMLLALGGCAEGVPAPRAVPEAPADATPFAGVLAALDRDHDDVVREAEYVTVALVAPPFDHVDADGDGGLSAAEVGALILTTDPMYFDAELQPGGRPPSGPPPGPPPPPNAGPSGGAAPPGPPPGPNAGPGNAPSSGAPRPSSPDAALLEALVFQVAELRARAPQAVLPTYEELRSAASHGLASPPGRAVLARLREGARAGNVVLPRSLGGEG